MTDGAEALTASKIRKCKKYRREKEEEEEEKWEGYKRKGKGEKE